MAAKARPRHHIVNIRALIAGSLLAFGIVGCGPRPAPLHPPMPIALDSVLGFSDPAHCRPTTPHARLLRALFVTVPGGLRPGRIDAPLPQTAAFGPIIARHAQDYWVISVTTAGTLFGLPLGRIDQALPDGGDTGDATYRFDVPIAVAARTLRARGFPVKPGAEVPINGGTGDGMEQVMSLLPDPDNAARTLFGCGYA